MDGESGASPSSPRPPRLSCGILQGVTGAALIPVVFITAKLETIFEQMEMRELPAPTEAFLALCRFLRWPPGMGFLVVGVAALILLALRGALDRFLKRMIWADILAWILGRPFWVLSILMPIIKIQQQLKK